MNDLRVAFYGGRQAGMIVLASILAKYPGSVKYVIPEDNVVGDFADNLEIPTIDRKLLNSSETFEKLNGTIDYLICCHGRRIIRKPLLDLKCINLHPCLYQYKGASPIERLIKDNNTRASVGVHYMVEEVDAGEVIVENFKEVSLDSIASVYNQLYPIYAKSVLDAIEIIKND